MTTNHPAIIPCLASLDKDKDVITLTIGSSVNGKMIRLPIGHYSGTRTIRRRTIRRGHFVAGI
jgi:hypothetical protein